jgi:hypothetical protein
MQRNPNGLSSYLHVGAGREHSEDVHGEMVEDVLVLRAEGVNSVQDNDLDVVIRFFLHELDERLGCGCKVEEVGKKECRDGIRREGTFYSRWILCKGCEDCGGFVLDG